MSADDIRQVEGSVVYKASKNETLLEAEVKALQLAIEDALNKEFGKTLFSEKSMYQEINNGESESLFSSHSSSTIKGEWIETIGEPVYNTIHDGTQNVITVNVKGLARQITPEKVNITTNILRNGINDNAESIHFNTQDRLFVSLQTEETGYCSIYFVDKSKNVYCLLPYPNMPGKPVKVKSGKKYVFFSPEENSLNEVNDKNVIDCFTSCQDSIEHNMIYIVFSPNQYSLAMTDEALPGQPETLTFKNFQKWLTDRHKNDNRMNVTIKNIFIKPTKQN